MQQVRDFVAPEHLGHVLGSTLTKHGEIAEQVEVQITNAKQVFAGLSEIADISSVGRTALEDYLINGVPVQSKFIAGFNQSLEHVREHLEKYPDFATDAAPYGYAGQAGYYHIPKDQYETIQKILNGDTAGFNARTINKCKELVVQIEEVTGKDFSEVVKPSLSNYAEVQLGKIDQTLDQHSDAFRAQTDERIQAIKCEEEQQKQVAVEQSGPSLAAGIQATVVGAAMGGVVTASLKVYAKISSGHKLTQFSSEDWQEVGLDFGKGAVKGGVSGAAIYSLTNLGGFAAPFAGGMVSAAIGITSLLLDYQSGHINSSECFAAACALSVETGLTAVGSAMGTAVIPIPVIGSIVGAMAAFSAMQITKQIMGNQEQQLIAHMQHEYEALIAKLTKQEQHEFHKITSYFGQLNSLIDAAFNVDVNQRLAASIELCRLTKFPEKEIIHNEAELDDFMLS